MSNRITLGISLLITAVVLLAMFAKQITDSQTANSLGQPQTVCGHVASTYYGPNIKGGATFLNLGKPYPNQSFTGMIWQKDRSNFPSQPEQEYQNKNICMTGRVEYHKGRPEMILDKKSQITMKW